MLDKILTFILIGIIALFGNWIGYGVSPIDALPGMIFIAAITILGFVLAEYIPLKIPIVIWVSVIALFVTSSIFPWQQVIVDATTQINFMALATPILAYAGLSFGKDLKEFKKLGWRIVVVSLFVYTGTFILATIIAEFVFRFTGQFN